MMRRSDKQSALDQTPPQLRSAGYHEARAGWTRWIDGVADPRLAQFVGEKYVSLETFKKSGQGVKTPVWFVLDGNALYLYTDADSWKVKRIRNNQRVRVAVCNMRGDVKGPWVDATASIIEGEEERAAHRLLDRKYVLKSIGNVFANMSRRTRATIRIDVA